MIYKYIKNMQVYCELVLSYKWEQYIQPEISNYPSRILIIFLFLYIKKNDKFPNCGEVPASLYEKQLLNIIPELRTYNFTFKQLKLWS